MIAKINKWMRVASLISVILLVSCGTGSRPDQAGGVPFNQQESACNVLSGYAGNLAVSGVSGATIAGGGQNGSPNQVSGNFGAVGGGEGNHAGEGSTVAGGFENTAVNFHATVSGGAQNLANSEEATVGGGLNNTASGRFTTVGGGSTNTASDSNATIGGGSGNQATYPYATVAGGTLNQADNVAAIAAGGNNNQAGGAYSSVLGGLNNDAQGNTATIGGGAGNSAEGAYSVVPGGFANQVSGAYSFAAGRAAVVAADHPGTFLFADASLFPFLSAAANEFAVRATGGVRFVTALDASGTPLAGVRLSPGSGSWENLSDATAKAGFVPIDGNQILDQLASMPISTWYYRGEDPSVRHIGPTAQDFQTAFHFGADSHYISTVDEEGVALAAIQALYAMVQQDTGNVTTTTADPSAQGQIASLQRQLTFSNVVAAAALLVATLALFHRKGKPVPRSTGISRSRLS
jgi:hypothetical protein